MAELGVGIEEAADNFSTDAGTALGNGTGMCVDLTFTMVAGLLVLSCGCVLFSAFVSVDAMCVLAVAVAAAAAAAADDDDDVEEG